MLWLQARAKRLVGNLSQHRLPVTSMRPLRALGPGVIPVVLSIICLTLVYGLSGQWQVVVDGDVLGVVKDPKPIVSFIDALNEEKKSGVNDSVSLISRVVVARSLGGKTVDETTMLMEVESRLHWGLMGAVITVDGKEVVALPDRQTAKAVVESLKQSLQAKLKRLYSDVKIVLADFSESIEIVQKSVTLDEVVDKSVAEEILLQGNTREYRHVVSRGETMSAIAASSGMKLAELIQANPGVRPTTLQIGQTLALAVPDPYVHYKVQAEVIEKKSIPYTTRYVYDDSMWNWERRTVSTGKQGTKEVTALVTQVNGLENDREIIGEKITKQPVEAVVKRGTKKATVIGSGRFIWPTEGVLTSDYGWRWGKFHRAIDIGASEGTPVKAADAGVVVYAGWKSSYGYMVTLDHGNGYTTLYAHCSKLLVSAGQKVSQGQTIARVGHTGYAFGSHLHWEVKYDGEHRDPLDFFK